MNATARAPSAAKVAPQRAAIESSDWATRFRADAPVSYRQGLDFAMSPTLRVFLKHTDENGEPQWAICVEEMPDFWMDAFEVKAEAIALCKAMGWKIVRP